MAPVLPGNPRLRSSAGAGLAQPGEGVGDVQGLLLIGGNLFGADRLPRPVKFGIAPVNFSYNGLLQGGGA